MTIQIIAEKTGLTKRMIRHYEEIGLLQAARSENNYREYSPEHVDRLLTIKAMRALGLSLENIAGVLSGNSLKVLQGFLQQQLLAEHELRSQNSRNIQLIKSILNSPDTEINLLWSQIDCLIGKASPHATSFAKPKQVKGKIDLFDELAKTLPLKSTNFVRYGDYINGKDLNKVSTASCFELYTHFLLFSEPTKDENFHRKTWSQFAKKWKSANCEHSISLTFESFGDFDEAVENIFSINEVVIVFEMEEAEIVLPYSHLHAFLRRSYDLYVRE